MQEDKNVKYVVFIVVQSLLLVAMIFTEELIISALFWACFIAFLLEELWNEFKKNRGDKKLFNRKKSWS